MICFLLLLSFVFLLPSTLSYTIDTNTTTQRDALIDLWRANLGAQWSGASGWLSNATHCSWQGVQCTMDNNSVASLSLGSFGLVSLALPPSFAVLTDLQALDASSNAIADVLLDASIAQFASLQFLSLTDNALSAMPASAISRLPSLQVLLLGVNRIADMSAASFGNRSLTMLQVLDLHENAIAHFDGTVLPLLPSLVSLSLSGNRELDSFPFAPHATLGAVEHRWQSLDLDRWRRAID
jgi:Leucine-rich repeat (LRR) protein